VKILALALLLCAFVVEPAQAGLELAGSQSIRIRIGRNGGRRYAPYGYGYGGGWNGGGWGGGYGYASPSFGGGFGYNSPAYFGGGQGFIAPEYYGASCPTCIMPPSYSMPSYSVPRYRVRVTDFYLD
jgi:hypothetical protein